MARVRSFFKYVNDKEKTQFKNSQCLLTISVGQAAHEGEVFASTVDLINSSFGSCIMIIDDTLQRHTMALNQKEDADFFYNLSLKEGDYWLSRNKKYYSRLISLKKIIRWDTWLKHPEYKIFINKIKSLIERQVTYKAAFDTTINSFLEKYYSRLTNPSEFDMARARDLCFDYALEECAALCLWPELNCQYEVYPGKYNAAMLATREYFIYPISKQLLQTLTIRFRNSKQLSPQHFVLYENTDIMIFS